MTRVLVVDDEPGIVSYLQVTLSRAGYDVETATDGETALRKARARAFHVVLTDLRMPEMDGLTLLGLLAREQPETEVIVLTAHGSIESAVEAMRLGAFDYIQKPVESPDVVRLTVARASERYAFRAQAQACQRDELTPLTYGAPAMLPVVRAIGRVAPTEATVLLTGESGTGKELAARTIHRLSGRSGGGFSAVNCAALSESLLESELFGHERGAFTGANARRRGRIELAEGGSFFLDEVGELPLTLQPKLLRVLQERTFERLGGGAVLAANVRWIAATNRDLEACVAAGSFREDLYHRLAVFPIRLPPLGARREDIVPLANRLLERAAASLGRPGLRFDETALAALERQVEWPGNIRQLANLIERSAILVEGSTLTENDLEFVASRRSTALGSLDARLDDIEREAIRQALERHNGNRKHAAEQLSIPLRTFYDKVKRYGFD